MNSLKERTGKISSYTRDFLSQDQGHEMPNCNRLFLTHLFCRAYSKVMCSAPHDIHRRGCSEADRLQIIEDAALPGASVAER